MGSGFKVQGSGFRVQGSGFRVQGSGFRVQGSGFRVQGSGFRVQGSGFRVQGSGFRVVVAASPRIYMGRCLKTAFKLQVTSHQSLASLLYFSAAPVEPFPNQKSEAGRILLPIFSNLIYFQRTLCTRGRSRRHLPWRGDHTAHAWRAWRCRSLPLLRPSPPS